MHHYRLTMRAVSLLFAGLIAIGASLASAEVGASAIVLPPDASGCTGTLPSNQIENCVSIVGNASYLQTVKGNAWTHFGSVLGHEEITGPSLPNGHINSSDITIDTTNNGSILTWAPYSSVTAGNYCAIFWQKVSGGYSENGPACEHVS